MSTVTTYNEFMSNPTSINLGAYVACAVTEMHIDVHQIKAALKRYGRERLSEIRQGERVDFALHIKKLIQQRGDTAVSNAMSYDRVRFNISPHVASKGGSVMKGIIYDAFGHHISKTQLCREGLEIVCRPSQFARFIIYRANAIKAGAMGGCNTFAELNAELFTPGSKGVDVSKNNHVPCDGSF